MAKLTEDEIVTLCVLKEKGESNCAIGRRLSVSEGAVRYHLRRAASKATDGRRKRCLIEQLGLEEVVRHWWQSEEAILADKRSPNVRDLWDHLVEEHDYSGSYKSVRKYVRGVFPPPKRRPFRRIETPPGAQTQSDWLELKMDLGGMDGPEKVYGFVMVLSHSRRVAVVWSRSMNQLAWHRVHNEAFKRLGGVAAVNRIDNLKTGVARGAGPWGEINTCYRAYARTIGFHVDPHEPRQPQQKGKSERCVSITKRLPLGRRFDSLTQLQADTDRQLEADSRRRICPATGRTIWESWQVERELLRPLPALLPEPFDLIRPCLVHKDCTIRFEGRAYNVPFRYVQQKVEVRGCAEVVQIVDRRTGAIVQEHPRHTIMPLVIDPACYEGESTSEVHAPRPLGKLSRKLQEIAATPVQLRSIEMYAQLAEVAR